MKQLPYTGKDVGICILDTGIAADHPDFRTDNRHLLILYPINAYPMMTMDTVPTLQEFYAEMELLQEENTEESLLAAGLQF